MSTDCDSPPTVRGAMVTDPKTTAPEATVADVRAVFGNDHVHMVLLTVAGILVGTLVRADLDDAPDDAPARPLAVLAGRTIPPSLPIDEARRVLDAAGTRRLAVVDGEGVLLGLLCLKRRRDGFCDDRGVLARCEERLARTAGRD